jgi:hypothetical protein
MAHSSGETIEPSSLLSTWSDAWQTHGSSGCAGESQPDHSRRLRAPDLRYTLTLVRYELHISPSRHNEHDGRDEHGRTANSSSPNGTRRLLRAVFSGSSLTLMHGALFPEVLEQPTSLKVHG